MNFMLFFIMFNIVVFDRLCCLFSFVKWRLEIFIVFVEEKRIFDKVNKRREIE